MRFSTFSKKALKVLGEKSPAILTSFGVAGVFGTAALAVRATPEASRQIMDAMSERTEPLTKGDVVRLVWREYVPAATVGVVTITAIIASHAVGTRRQAALLSLYTLSEKASSEYREKVREVVGVEKEAEVRESILKDRVAEYESQKNNSVTILGSGDYLCRDSLTGQFFKSNKESILAAVNVVNASAINNVYSSHNEFYSQIGLSPVALGEEVGWRSDVLMDVEFSTCLSPEGKPCLSIDYRTHPIRGYWKGH